MKLDGKIKTCLRYVTDITGPDLLSLVEFGGGGNFENWGICNLRKGDQILMKFDIRRILCFKAVILNSNQIL